MLFNKYILNTIFIILAFTGCKKNTTKPVVPVIEEPKVELKNDVDFWLTRGDQSTLLQKQTIVLAFGTVANSAAEIKVDTAQTYQTIDGFGYTLTGGSASLINQLDMPTKTKLIQELFGNGPSDIGVSYLRVSIGASDLSENPYSYNDLAGGEKDQKLEKFSIASEKKDLIPVLKLILAVNPKIKIMGSPWSPPVWMKTNDSFVGGSLKPEFQSVYAQYFVKYIQQMKAEGIPIDAITIQNEPLNPNNNPSLLMEDSQQADFIKNNLGPAFKEAGITTKIIAYDHNCDKVSYPMNVADFNKENSYVDGAAFHLYAGEINALTTFHNAYPTKNVYFTEQYTAANGNFGGDLKWHLKNVIIGSMRNWSRNALEWNLANDQNYGPHTNGGCNDCKGAITINGNTITKNVAYYITAHASKFVPAGSIRIGSNTVGNLQNVAFKRPDGKKVLIVENDGSETTQFNIKADTKWVTTSLPAGGVGTYIW
jgi:glucosylceramidase